MDTFIYLSLFFVVMLLPGCQPEQPPEEWTALFDGATFNGWKKSVENPESFTIEDGAIKCSGNRAHLYYEGVFKNFEVEAEIKTSEQSNSGVFIHTSYQRNGWPKKGYEIQVNNTYRGSERNPERRKTGSIYNIRNVYYPLVNDDEWFKLRVKVVGNLIEVFVNEIKVNQYIEPENPWRTKSTKGARLGKGTIALQAHDPGSTTWYRNIKARALPEEAPVFKVEDIQWDELVTKLMHAGFPLIDYHVHIKGGLTKKETTENSLRLGINYGIAPNCGLHFPVTNDESLYAYIDSVKTIPAFKGMQAEGREWVKLFSPEAVAQFDYVFTDALTFTDYKGRRNRLWIPEEVWIEDKEQFMEQLVEKIEAIFSQEPVDIYVNPTVLPEELMDEYEQLWTPDRMKRVVKVLAENNVALEINSRYKVPSAQMIKMAKEAGVKFTFGTNNLDNNIGQLEYCIQMLEECKLAPNDMFEVKPFGQKPVNMKGLPDNITG